MTSWQQYEGIRWANKKFVRPLADVTRAKYCWPWDQCYSAADALRTGAAKNSSPFAPHEQTMLIWGPVKPREVWALAERSERIFSFVESGKRGRETCCFEARKSAITFHTNLLLELLIHRERNYSTCSTSANRKCWTAHLSFQQKGDSCEKLKKWIRVSQPRHDLGWVLLSLYDVSVIDVPSICAAFRSQT